MDVRLTFRLIPFPIAQDVYSPPPVEIVRPAEFSPLFEKLQPLSGEYGGWCVAWIQHLLGFPKGFRGDAWTIRPNSFEPEIGSIVLFRIHAALVIGRIGDQLVLAESNINEDKRIMIGRTVPVDSPSIRGYWRLDSGTIAFR